MAYEYSIYNGSTTRKISYTHWINLYFDTRKAEINNNKLILTSSIYIGTNFDGHFVIAGIARQSNYLNYTEGYTDGHYIPFLTDEFYAEDGKLIHSASIVFKPSDIKQETLFSLKNRMLDYKHKKYNNDIQKLEDTLIADDDLFILAVCGDKEAISLLKNRDVYEKYFNIELDDKYLEEYSATAEAYNTFEYLQHQGGSIKEVIPLDK